MPFYFPFGQQLQPLRQEDKSPKKVFVLGVYAYLDGASQAESEYQVPLGECEDEEGVCGGREIDWQCVL